jgi:cob(I)alamin adenosyltransferase
MQVFMQIYTKTGDDGETNLFDGTRVKKNDIRIELIGTIDEMSAVLGVAKVCARKNENNDAVQKFELIQKDLINVNGLIAKAKPSINAEQRIEEYENIIDIIKEEIEIHNDFVLYGDSELESLLQHARAICRRAERICIKIDDKLIGKYLNRLSDLLYVLALNAMV